MTFQTLIIQPKLAAGVVMLLGVIFYPDSAYSGTASANMTNTATVANNCTITATGFSTTYDPIVANKTTNLNTAATVATTCTLNATATITLSQGANPNTGSSEAAPLRRLKHTANTTFLNYTLYKDSERSTAWGNTSDTGVNVTGTGASVSTTVYAQIPADQSVPAGTYSDTVTATVSF